MNFKSFLIVGMSLTNLVFASPAALSDYGLFAQGDLNLRSSRVDGRVAALGTISLTDYSVGMALHSNSGRCDLSTSENLYFTRGSVPKGAICVAGFSQLNEVGPSPKYSPDTHDMAMDAREAHRYSDYVEGLYSKGVSYTPGKPIVITGTDTQMNVFTIPSHAMASTHEIIIQAPWRSNVIVNVTGSYVSFQSASIKLNGIPAERVLFNMADASQVTLTKVNWQGSLLAPHAKLTFNDGRLNGSAFVHSASGNGYFSHHPFNTN